MTDYVGSDVEGAAKVALVALAVQLGCPDHKLNELQDQLSGVPVPANLADIVSQVRQAIWRIRYDT